MTYRMSAALLFALLVAGGSTALAYTGQELAPGAKLDIAQARAIALKARPGNLKKEELENEGGLRYSFVVRQGAKDYEVGVDAQTGRILENKAEGPNPD